MKNEENFENENDVISKSKSPFKWVIMLLASLSLVTKKNQKKKKTFKINNIFQKKQIKL